MTLNRGRRLGEQSFGEDLTRIPRALQGPVWLDVPILHTSFDGDAFSDVGSSTKIENTSWVSTIPAAAKALLVRIVASDSGPAGEYYFVIGPSVRHFYAAAVRPAGGDIAQEQTAWVPCTNGDLWYQCEASGAATLDIALQVWGYWL